ncbi:hypothetical protein B0H13DRAFT_2228509 [Mycena leptocephala]|nr:hypothetical protein B0H13DRAFT_2228509 [Mycena leptocephala]
MTPSQRAQSMEPPASSPMSSLIDTTPIKEPRGRPQHTPGTRRLNSTLRRLGSSQHTPEYQQTAAKLEQKRVDAAAARARNTAEKAAQKAQELAQVQQVLHDITQATEDGGYNFDDLDDFFQGVFQPGGDQQMSAKITRYVHSHGAEHARTMFARSAPAKEEYISGELADIYQREGRAIQEILTRNSTTTVTELLKVFSMEQLAAEIQKAAPWLWKVLVVLSEPDKSTRPESAGEARRDKGLVFTTICALISVMRSHKANNFQLVIGLFLLGSGFSKREMEVLAHAGLSISYTSITSHVKGLSKEGMERLRGMVKSCMCQIVWDNLNIAFRVAAERLKAKNHFDNGTTATVIPVFDPATGGNAKHGTLPFSMKAPRERTLPVLDWTPEDVLPSPKSAEELSSSCFWQLKRMALEHIPGITPQAQAGAEGIPLHKSEQYPLPAMNLDESSLEGTLEVYLTILRNMGLDDEALKVHGLLFDDGDLLTDSLKEKASMQGSVRRWGLFHGEMAGCRLTLLKLKPIIAGWAGKKATPWQPAHELIHISLPAHIVDGFRIYCGHNKLEEWAKAATTEEFNRVAKIVFDKLFSTRVVDELRTREERDITLENAILYNRDALFYIEFIQAIKKGDIGRVLNVLSIWMVMMRTPKTMPRYADAMFETLVRLRNFPPKLRELFLYDWLFKPVDLLQEHQNFWAKIIYTAKGTNKSWEWLSMITVCIFTLRDAMRTVQTAFNIPAYGEKHKTPEITAEVALLVEALMVEKIQTFVARRPANDHTSPNRDMIKEGSLYANTRKAFWRFTRDMRKAEKRGFTEAEPGDVEGDEEEEGAGQEEDYNPTEDDLRVDDEEFFNMEDRAELLAAAMNLVNDIMDE